MVTSQLTVSQGQPTVSQGVQPAVTQANTVPKLKPLSQWARLGLDLSSAALAKLQSKESSYDDSRTKYDLEPEKFEN